MIKTETMSDVMLRALRNLIANDSYAMTFQSMGQYRTALLSHFDNLVEAPDAKIDARASQRAWLRPQATAITLDAEQQTAAQVAAIDKHLDAVLRASGSALRHYSMQKTLDDMRAAMQAAVGEAPATSAAALPDHVVLETVNQLRDIAIKYHAAGQLREQIAYLIVPLLKGTPAAKCAALCKAVRDA